ncbi:MAG: 2-octaprenyl-6-methoxyphenyl hydroxylase [Wolbachia endosymbiont of Fragariocoptes setiger]|nr:2-octaprenyl-6-methoxyphenyl hydroxylase [Wolbachia endosymbiont of Fragariocoptes setiger]
MYYDAIISGGGLLGLITAISLNNLSVAVIEKNNIPHKKNDNRAFAISQGSKQILENLGIWQLIGEEAEPILDILILEGNSPINVHYDHKMVGEEPMGYVIDNATIWNAINKNFLDKLKIYSPHSYKTISNHSGYVEVILENGEKLISSLFICAEGKYSKIPELFSIPVLKFNYQQSSIVCNVEHKLHHENLAIERFFPSGPFAVLPMKGGYTSSIVWTEKTEIAEMLMNLSIKEFTIEMEKRFMSEVILKNKRKFYPLSFSFVRNLYKNRILLIGDAARSIHPIAGQGFNLGIRDVESTARHIIDAKFTGVDIGSEFVLRKISRERGFDSVTMALATDGLNRIFSNKMLCFKVLRNLGLMIVENSSFLKNRLIRHAMGIK